MNFCSIRCSNYSTDDYIILKYKAPITARSNYFSSEIQNTLDLRVKILTLEI